MANITGVVEVAMKNKFNPEKFAMKLEGNDTWFGQAYEWMDTIPEKGDTVEFSGGKTGKYIQYLKIVGKGSGGSTASTPKAAKSYSNNNLGIELGHAANNATQLVIAQKGKAATLDDVQELTVEFYNMMKGLREKFDGKAEKKKPAPKPVEEESFDDDEIPF